MYSVAPRTHHRATGEEIFMTALKSKLLHADNRPTLVAACEQLIEDEGRQIWNHGPCHQNGLQDSQEVAVWDYSRVGGRHAR